MDADRWLGSTAGRWPCYMPNSGYADETTSAAAAARPSSSVSWLPSQLQQLTACSGVTTTCHPSYVDITATPTSSSSTTTTHAGLLKPSIREAADRQINDTG